MMDEPLPDVQEMVREHTKRAYVLAQITIRPPGYTTETWALHWMDHTYADLDARYEAWKAVHFKRQQAEFDEMGMVDWWPNLPAVPEQPPPELATKARLLYQTWTRDLLIQECREVLQPLVGSPRTQDVMSQAANLVHDLTQKWVRLRGELIPPVKVTMLKDLTFEIRIDRDFKRRGL